MGPFCWAEYERGTGHLLRRAPLVCTPRFCSEDHAAAGEFFYISKLVSFVIKAEGRSRVLVRQARGESVGDGRLEGPVIIAIGCGFRV